MRGVGRGALDGLVGEALEEPPASVRSATGRVATIGPATVWMRTDGEASSALHGPDRDRDALHARERHERQAAPEPATAHQRDAVDARPNPLRRHENQPEPGRAARRASRTRRRRRGP